MYQIACVRKIFGHVIAGADEIILTCDDIYTIYVELQRLAIITVIRNFVLRNKLNVNSSTKITINPSTSDNPQKPNSNMDSLVLKCE